MLSRGHLLVLEINGMTGEDDGLPRSTSLGTRVMRVIPAPLSTGGKGMIDKWINIFASCSKSRLYQILSLGISGMVASCEQQVFRHADTKSLCIEVRITYLYDTVAFCRPHQQPLSDRCFLSDPTITVRLWSSLAMTSRTRTSARSAKKVIAGWR